MDLIEIIKYLVSVGLSPIEIGTIIVCLVLYRKTEQLDAALHACLDGEKQTAIENRLDSVK